MKAIIFDFNGTLLKDSRLHLEAWKTFIKEKTGKQLQDEEFMNQAWGLDNTQTITKYLNINDKHMIDCLSEEKEKIYRELCINSGLQLIRGATILFDDLKDKNIPFTIATASIKSNVDFYFEHFNLGLWFDINKVTYNDGLIPGKPNPEIYIKSCKILNVKPSECIVVEDTIHGVIAAKRAGIKEIYLIKDDNTFEEEITDIVHDFVELKQEFEKYNIV